MPALTLGLATALESAAASVSSSRFLNCRVLGLPTRMSSGIAGSAAFLAACPLLGITVFPFMFCGLSGYNQNLPTERHQMKLPEYDNRSSSSYDSSSSEAEDAKFTILGLGLPLALVGVPA